MAKIFTFNSTNVINYTICILLVSQDYYFLYYQSVWLSLQWKWWLDLKQLIKCIVRYMINDCNSVTLEGNGNPLQYSCLEKSHGWRNLVGCSPWGPEELDTTERLHFHFHALEKEMTTHSSVLAWRIPETGEPGGLPSMGSHRVGHDWSDLA